jgi:hypothetical protein
MSAGYVIVAVVVVVKVVVIGIKRLERVRTSAGKFHGEHTATTPIASRRMTAFWICWGALASCGSSRASLTGGV